MSMSNSVSTSSDFKYTPFPEENSSGSSAASLPLGGYAGRFSGHFSTAPDGAAGKQISERVARLCSAGADADFDGVVPAESQADPVETAAGLVVRIDGNLREMGNAYAALWSAQQARSGFAFDADERQVRKSLRDNVRYSDTDLKQAESVAAQGLSEMSLDSSTAAIAEHLEKTNEEVQRLSGKVGGRVAAAYSKPAEGNAVINVNVPGGAPAAAGDLPAPVAEGVSKAANWLADKMKDNPVTRLFAKALAGLVLVVAWAVPTALLAMGIVFPPATLITVPLAAATYMLLTPVLTNFFGALWGALSPKPAAPPPTASITVKMQTVTA